MKQLIFSLTCLGILLARVAQGGDDLPFFHNLRLEAANQLTLASNTVPVNKKLTAVLRSALKTIDKTKPTLIAGSGALGTLAKSLGNTSLSNTFLPIITDARAAYLGVLDPSLSALQERLSHTIPGSVQTSAQTALNKLAAAIEATRTNVSLARSLVSLRKAATALTTAEGAVLKAETAKPGSSFLTATIVESNQGTNLFKVTRKGFLSGTYNLTTGDVDIEASELKRLAGKRVQTRGLSLTATPPGEGTYTLSLTNGTQGYAYYQRILAPRMAEFEAEEPNFEFQELYTTVDVARQMLGAGTITLTLDLDREIAWGTFALTALGNGDPNLVVTMTGAFLVRLEMFDEGGEEEIDE